MNIPRPVTAVFVCDGAALPPAWRSTGNNYALNHLGAEPRMTVRLSNLSHRLLRRVAPLADDLVRIAAYVYVADQMISRGTLKDIYADRWQRQMYLAVPVRDPDHWNHATVRGQLSRWPELG